MGIRIKRRKKQNIIDNKDEELIKRLDELIRWIKEKQIKSEEENKVWGKKKKEDEKNNKKKAVKDEIKEMKRNERKVWIFWVQ